MITETTAHIHAEIGRQPRAWLTAATQAAEAREILPRSGERVAVIGCGTSWFMAAAYAARREQFGRGETDAFAASQFPSGRNYDRVLAISRSGTTTEVVRAIDQTKAPVTALVAVADSPVAAAADDAVVLDFADELSVVQTLFATTTLMLLRASLGESVEPIVQQAQAILAGSYEPPIATLAAEQFSFLGQGWSYGVAQEAALKMREAAQLWTESYPQMEYRHGPISIAQPGRVVWILDDAVDGLVDDVAATGAVLVNDHLDPVADLVRAQMLAVQRAESAELDPDHPRHLTRSVVLDDGAIPG